MADINVYEPGRRCSQDCTRLWKSIWARKIKISQASFLENIKSAVRRMAGGVRGLGVLKRLAGTIPRADADLSGGTHFATPKDLSW
jgi:hypothetical protein